MENEASEREKKALSRGEKTAEKRMIPLFKVDKNGLHKSGTIDFLRVLFYPLHALVYPFKLHGPTRVGKGAFIYVGNHYCLWDVFYPAHTTREGIHFLAKESILETPVLGFFARRAGVIGAMRDGSDVRTLMDSIRALRSGDKVSMFPEGTRNKVSDEEFLPFHAGAALMAIKTKTPIVPFAICNRPRIFRRTHVMFGEPFEFSEYYNRKLTQADYTEADEKLKARLYALREEFRAGQKKKK